MKNLLKTLVSGAPCYVEARYHKRTSKNFMVQKGRVDTAHHASTVGVGVRALVNGSWGFSATSQMNPASLKQALNDAIEMAKLMAKLRKSEPISLAKANLATQDIIGPDYHELYSMSSSDKLQQIIELEKQIQTASKSIQSASCSYKEIFEEKIVVTSDGAEGSYKIALPEVSFSAIAEGHGEQSFMHQGAGVSGGWTCLYNHPSIQNATENTAKLAVDLLDAKYPDGGVKTCILSPDLVGLLCHEAIGHTVEADFVTSGSVAQGMIGKRVGSDLVNMADTGCEVISGYAVGNIPFDDEGVKTETTTIIENGILKSYLHNRESAAEFGVNPTGNARAWLYNDEPLIRMRNTYFLPGTNSLDQMISEVEDGYLVEGAGSGQADSNGEFMFGSSYIWEIKSGKKTRLLRDATLSGIAFDVLDTVDAVSKEFQWSLGTGYCGKGQPAKVDAGGPYVRCKIQVGGR